MKDFFSSITSFAGSLIYLTLFVATPYGIYHAFDNHDNSQGFISVFLPPYAWYMVAESVGWHDDFSDVNWRQTVPRDIRTGIILLSALVNPEPEKAMDIEIATEEFRKTVSSYPVERREKIHAAIRLYVEYAQSLSADFSSQLRDSVTKAQIETIELQAGPESLEIERKLRAYEAIDDLLKQLALAISLINEKFRQGITSGRRLSPEAQENLRLMIYVLEVNNRILNERRWKAYEKLVGKVITD